MYLVLSRSRVVIYDMWRDLGASQWVMASWQDIGGIDLGDIDIVDIDIVGNVDIDIANIVDIVDIVGRILVEKSPNPYHV